MKWNLVSICFIVAITLWMWGGAAEVVKAAPPPVLPAAAWLNIELKDVVSGRTFKLVDLKGDRKSVV